MLNRSAAWRMRVARTAIAAAAVCLIAGIGAQGASAETTHRFLRNITLPVGGVEPLGVDPSGNIIVWSTETLKVYKFSQNGAPVNFSGLGTNELDGAGGFNCPSVPSDCDRIPYQNGFGPTEFSQKIRADMNQSTEGPQAGWIYVDAIEELPGGQFHGHLVSFDAGGNYRGTIDESKVTPFAPGTRSAR